MDGVLGAVTRGRGATGMIDGSPRGHLITYVIIGEERVRGAEGRVPLASSHHSTSDGTKDKVES